MCTFLMLSVMFSCFFVVGVFVGVFFTFLLVYFKAVK